MVWLCVDTASASSESNPSICGRVYADLDHVLVGPGAFHEAGSRVLEYEYCTEPSRGALHKRIEPRLARAQADNRLCRARGLQ